jgi:hypothetical protein
MPDWRRLIEDYFKCNDDPNKKITYGDGVTCDDLSRLEATWGAPLPQEFRSLYQTVNGAVLISSAGNNWTLVMPIDRLKDEVANTAEWFPEEFREFAVRRFRPFISIYYPDKIGYKISEEGVMGPELYYFNTSNVDERPESGDPTEDFLYRRYDGIADFLLDLD